MNREELDKRKEELWEDYQSAQVEGYFEDYDLNDDGTYRVCEKEMSIIREMQTMRSEGVKLQTIADTLTNKHRKKFMVSWVHKLLNREDLAFVNV